jgi:hypothetical protein
VQQNRYFALSPVAEPDLERLERGETLAEGSPLQRAGLVISADVPFTPPGILTIPEGSMLDDAARPGSALVASLLRDFAWARLSLACAPSLVLAAAAGARRVPRVRPEADALRRAAGAYETASHIAGAHDKCLAWSLALTRLCRRHGEQVVCVIGVSGRPFQAHSWVQSEDELINDRYDHVRNFVPILTL